VLKVATIGEPPSLDRHLSPSVVTSIPMSHVVETLFTRDRDFNPIPLLAEGHTVRVLYTTGNWLDIDTVEDALAGGTFQ